MDSSDYPFAVQRAGKRGRELFDACLKKLTTRVEEPLTEEVAVMMIMMYWDEMIGMLPPPKPRRRRASPPAAATDSPVADA